MEPFSEPEQDYPRPLLLDLDGVSLRTGIPVNTLRYYRATGQGPRTFKLGGRVVAYASDVEEWVRRQYEQSGRGGS